jgi:eukaryotic-like serine/threonine-protein kinase
LLLATSADSRLRDHALALTLAKRAVELDPTNPDLPITLGIAHYRTGDWNAAIAALETSARLRQGGNGFDWFFMAMAHWQSGNKEEARRWYDKAAEWAKQRRPRDEELTRFRLEAAGLLGVTETDHAAPTTAPAAQRPAPTPK